MHDRPLDAMLCAIVRALHPPGSCHLTLVRTCSDCGHQRTAYVYGTCGPYLTDDLPEQLIARISGQGGAHCSTSLLQPLRTAGQTVGMVEVHAFQPDAFPAFDFPALARFSRIAGAALQAAWCRENRQAQAATHGGNQEDHA